MPLNQALASLPHGTEFRFVDELTTLVPGESASAIYHLKGSEDFLKGHFPGQPILPGVLMIEAIAQLGGIIAQTDTTQPPLKNVRLTSVKNAKILGTIAPGDTITLTATLEGRLGTLIQIKGHAHHGETKIASAIVTLSGDL